MTRTVRQVIDVASEHEQIDAGRALQLFNEAHTYILSQIHLVPDQTTAISLVAGQQEYGLADNVAKVWDASYFTGPNAFVPIQAKNVDSLFEDLGPNWQNQPPGQPWAFYERGGMLGLVPAPDTTTVGGYPVVTLFYTPNTTLGLDDTLPTLISSIYPWVYRMCELIALSGTAPFLEKAAKRDKYHALFDEQIHYLREYIFGRVARDRARAAVRVPRLRRA